MSPSRGLPVPRDPCALGSFLHSRWLQPLPARRLQRRASFWLLAGERLQLEQTIRREIGSINQLSRIFNICFAHGLICTNLLPLQKESFLHFAPEGLLNTFLTVGRRCCPELQAAAFISATCPGFLSPRPGGRCRAEAGAGSQVERCLGRKVEAALLKVGVQPSWQLGGFPGSRCSSWWTGVFLVS